MSINKVMIAGNLTRSPELRSTQGGTAVLTFGVAVNDRRKNPQTGDWEDYPNYVDCALFGKRADTVSKFIDKGSKVAIEGSLRYSSWEKDGHKRSPRRGPESAAADSTDQLPQPVPERALFGPSAAPDGLSSAHGVPAGPSGHSDSVLALVESVFGHVEVTYG